MSQLTELKAATTLHEVAAILGYKTSSLSYILYHLKEADKYKEFEIPKSDGGKRTIKAPTQELKLLQRKLAALLEDCLVQIRSETGYKDDTSHGFRQGRSIFSNAKVHRNRRWVFNTDIQNFFGSINFGRVRGFFIKDNSFKLNEKVATIIAQIACCDNQLPQGSPCSPVISNLIGHVLDTHLVRLAAKNGCQYTRYVDDLTFSTNKPIFPETIAKTSPETPHEWSAGKSVVELIKHAGFSINEKKTRMQYWDSRQEVTGLVVNRKVNVRQEYRRLVRSMVHHLFTTGKFEHIRYQKDDKGLLTKISEPGNLKELHGMLGFIDYVDNLNRITTDTEHTNNKTSLKSKEQVYKRFLIYKEFYASQMPVIICEGSTDNVYIVHALRSLAEQFPQLAEKKGKKITLKVRLFKYVATSTGRILGLTGGTGDLGKFMRSYYKETKRFGPPPHQYPVILLVDNDSGALGNGKPFLVAKELTKKEVIRTNAFTRICGNLYLVPTPLKGAAESMIEDFFTDETLNEKLNGKSFNPDNNADITKFYGKSYFAHHVVRQKANTIDFSGFAELLSNISLVVSDYDLMSTQPK